MTKAASSGSPCPSSIFSKSLRAYSNFGYTTSDETNEDSEEFMECFFRTCAMKVYKRCVILDCMRDVCVCIVCERCTRVCTCVYCI